MAKNKPSVRSANVSVKYADGYEETIKKHPEVIDKVNSFIEFKSDNPTALFGKTDSMMSTTSELGKKRIRHAHLTLDLSIFYRIYGTPSILYIFGVFTHQESGTGHQAGNKATKNFATLITNRLPDELKESLVDEIALLLECELACKKEIL